MFIITLNTFPGYLTDVLAETQSLVTSVYTMNGAASDPLVCCTAAKYRSIRKEKVF